MKFDTCSIYKEDKKGKAEIQVTFDEDYNLPAYKPDVSALITSKGTVNVEEIKVTAGRVAVKGTLKFSVLYRAEQNSMGFCSVSGDISFQEMVAVDAAEEFDTASVTCLLEDLSVHITNSRKLAIRGLMQMEVEVSEFVTVNIPCACQESPAVEVLKKPIEYLHLTAFGKDQCRVHEELELPANKLNVQDVIWTDLRLDAIRWELASGGIRISGDLVVFCLYQGEPGIRLEWYEHRIPIICHVDASQTEPEQVCYLKVTDTEWNLQVQEDLEGENRVLVVDGSVKCEYRVYQENKEDVIQDLYALNKTLIPAVEPVALERLLMKNDSRCSVNDTMQLEQGQKEILQICSCGGEIQVDRQAVVDDGIWVEGAIRVYVLYLTQDDAVPVDAIEGMVPFQYRIEVPGISQDCRYELSKDVNLLSVMMKNSGALEVQAILDFHVIVFACDRLENIREVKEEPVNIDLLMSMPGLTGIRIKEGDNLWSVAKANHTTCELIRQSNPNLEEPLKPGNVLLLLKQVE